MDFNPNTWGTVAEWVGGLGTAAAFLITAFVVYRDAKVRRMAQVRKVVFTVETLDLAPITVKAMVRSR